MPVSLAPVKIGRPSKMSLFVVKKLEEAFLWGASDEQACINAGISRTTLHNYCKINPDFLNRKELLKENTTLHAKKRIFEDIKDDKSQTAVSSAKWTVEHNEGRSKQQIHIEKDINFTVVRKQYELPAGDVKMLPDSVVDVESEEQTQDQEQITQDAAQITGESQPNV